ncbi:MAG TPA: TasA family protein [Patescibacteria group bacterium]|nr:TasA family protein [Patescibacteria group bacterium]
MKIAKSLAVIAFVVITVAGATYAWFNDQGQVNGTSTTGDIELRIYDQNTTNAFNFHLTNLAPGETKQLNFDIANVGTLPQYLRGWITGEWGDSSLDENLMQIVRVERWTGSAWDTLTSNDNGITGAFYYSPNGTDSNLFQVDPNNRAQLRLTVKLDEDANNTYENRTFNAQLTIQARQTMSGAQW